MLLFRSFGNNEANIRRLNLTPFRKLVTFFAYSVLIKVAEISKALKLQNHSKRDISDKCVGFKSVCCVPSRIAT